MSDFQRFIDADDRNLRAFNRDGVAFDRSVEQHEEMREFMREMTLRVRRARLEHSRELREATDYVVNELRAGRDEFLAAVERFMSGGA